MAKKALDYLTNDLKREYKYINLSAYEYSEPTIHPAPNKPLLKVKGKVDEIAHYFDNYVSVSDILKKINDADDKDVSNYYIDVSYCDLDGTEIRLKHQDEIDNSLYESQMKKYEKSMLIYNEEKQLLPKIKKLWKVWSKKVLDDRKISQYKHLKSILEKDGLL